MAVSLAILWGEILLGAFAIAIVIFRRYGSAEAKKKLRNHYIHV
jgi:hypothetical protein